MLRQICRLLGISKKVYSLSQRAAKKEPSQRRLTPLRRFFEHFRTAEDADVPHFSRLPSKKALFSESSQKSSVPN